MPGGASGWWGAGGSSRWVVMLCALCVAATAVAPGSANALSYASVPPAMTTSYYEQSASPSLLYRQGEQAGKAGARGIVILDFGRPAESDGTYGTMGFHGTFVPLAEIVSGVESYISAYYRYAPGYLALDVAVGTNNSCGAGQPCGPRICGCADEPVSYYDFGASWASVVERLSSWSLSLRAERGYTDLVRVVAADDAEPSYDPGYRNTYDLLSGYAAAVQGREPAMVDYGSAERSWSEAQLLQVAYGFPPDVPMPQVYYSSQVSEWAALLSYAKVRRHLRVRVFGVLAGGDPEVAYSEMLRVVRQVTAQQAIPWLSTIVP